jgi:molybdenum-dependent DNA-binding transcriptional regulator ModE
MSPIEIIVAVLHLIKTDFAGITNLGNRILTKGIYVETGLFTTPKVPKDEFETQLNAAILAVAQAENGGSLAERSKQIGLFYKMLRKLLNYVNGLYEDMQVELEKSGFETNAIPTPHTVFNQPVIKKIVKGNEDHTIKISIEPLEGDAKKKKARKNYIVRTYVDMTTEEFVTISAGTNSRKIILHDVPYMESLYYTIIVENAAGPSPESARRKFTLTD